MALISEIQLQNKSILPVKLDDTQKFTAAGLTATETLAVSDIVPVSASGMLTLKNSGNVSSYFQTTAVDGDVDLFLNNDSDIYWNIKLSGSNNDAFLINALNSDTNPTTYFSINKTGNVGFGTTNAASDTVAEFVSNNSSSAAIQLTNSNDSTSVRMVSDSSSGSIGTKTNNKFGIKVNDIDQIFIDNSGNVGISNPTPYGDNTYGTITFGGNSWVGSQISEAVNNDLYIVQNAYLDTSTWTRITDLSLATKLTQNASGWSFQNSTTNTGAITWQDLLTLDNTGNLTVSLGNFEVTTGTATITGNTGIGGASTGDKLYVVGTTKLTSTLDVGGNTTITGDVLPEADGTRSLGSDLVRWGNLYADNISVTNGVSGLITNDAENKVLTSNNNGTANAENNLGFDGTTLCVVGDIDVSTTLITGGSITSGGSVTPSVDGTNNLGTSLLRWGTLYVDTIGDNGQALGVAATTLSFDTAATIDTSGSNQLDINTGTANLAITSGNVTMSGGLTVDTSTLVVDSTNNNVGIATTPNAAYSLDVNGNINLSGDLYVGGSLAVFSNWSTNATTIYRNSNVGIGDFSSSAPAYKLDVDGHINISTGNTLKIGGVDAVFSNWTEDGSGDIYRGTKVGIGDNQSGYFSNQGLDVSLEIVGNSSTSVNLLRLTNWNNDALTTAAAVVQWELRANNNFTNYIAGEMKVGRSGDWNTSSTGTMDAYMSFETRVDDVLAERIRIHTDGNVGIGVSAPTEALDVDGNINISSGNTLKINGVDAVFSNWTNNSTYIYRDSEVGIGSGFGSLTPAAKLEIRNLAGGDQNLLRLSADVFSAGSPAAAVLQYGLSDSSVTRSVAAEIKVGNDGNWNYSTASTVDAYMSFETIVDNSLAERMRIHTDGNVGIGVSAPTEALDIDGSINLSAGNTLKINGVAAVFSNWTVDGSDIYRDSKVGVGSTIRGNVFYGGVHTGVLQLEGTDFGSTILSQIVNSTTNYPSHVLARSRGTSVNSNVIVADNDILGEITGQGNDGTDFIQSAGIQFNVDGSPATDVMPGRITFHTNSGGTSTSERMRIDKDGSIIMGGSHLSATPGNANVVAPYGDGTDISGGDFNIYAGRSTGTGAGGDITFHTSPAGGSTGTGVNAHIARMTITSSGNVGIGTNVPTRNLTVSSSTNAVISVQNSGQSTEGVINAPEGGTINVGTTGLYDLQLSTNNIERMRITSSGSVGVGITPSAWGSNFKALQINDSVIYNNTSGDTFLGSNLYWDGTDNKYINSDYAMVYRQQDGAHAWFTAPSGTSGNTITFTETMNLTSDGDLTVAGNIESSSMMATSFTTPTNAVNASSCVDMDTISVTANHTGVFEIYVSLNPQPSVNTSLSDFYYGRVIVGNGLNASNVLTQYINYIEESPNPRDLYDFDASNNTTLITNADIGVFMLNGGTEYEELAAGTDYTIRVKVDNLESGQEASSDVKVRIKRVADI